MLYLYPKFSLGLSKMLNNVRYRCGLDMKYFSLGCDQQNLLT